MATQPTFGGGAKPREVGKLERGVHRRQVLGVPHDGGVGLVRFGSGLCEVVRRRDRARDRDDGSHRVGDRRFDGVEDGSRVVVHLQLDR